MISRIISEEINNYLYNIILEKKGKSKKKKERDVWKNALKAVGGRRKNYNRKKDKATNPYITKSDEDAVTNILDNDAINLAAIARQVYPDLTPAGAQSKLRKKVKGEKSDSGSVYKIKKKEANKIDKIISNLL